MHKAAKIIGIVWMGAIAAAGIILLAADTQLKLTPTYYGHGLVFALFGAALPGVLLYRWGRGPYVRPPTVKEMLTRKTPISLDPSHVMKLDADQR
jgi:hypothetical protein